MQFEPTRAAGLAALLAFAPSAGRRYAETRNSDGGPAARANVSMLSRYLRYRLLTEEEVIAAIHAAHTPTAVEKFTQEVLWRTYWKGWLELRPCVWAGYQYDLASLTDKTGGWRRDYERALAGNTGIDCFDAWVGELAEHGYLHNHARMWFASIWIFTLRLPWQLGADLFWRELYDGDPASNTLSWRWVAGLQTIGKTYLARADNIAKYTHGRFSPAGLATRADPVTVEPLPPPRRLIAVNPLPAGRVGLLIAEDDLSPESLPLYDCEVAAVATLEAAHGRSAAVERFVAAARSDAAARASRYFGVPATALAGDMAGAVLAWAAEQRLTELVVATAPTGPSARLIADVEQALAQAGVRLTRVRRSWDTRLWPHAGKGFFAFWAACVQQEFMAMPT